MLYIFDKSEQLVAILANEADACPYTEAVHTEKLNQENTFTFSIPADRPEAAFVKEGAYVAFRDMDLYWQMFEIQKVTDIHNESGIVRQAYAEHIFYELLNDIIEDVRPYNTTAQAALTAALANTRWQPGIVYDFGLNSVNFYYENVLSAIQKIVNTWGGELRFRIEITENAITGRYVDILNRRGEDTGKSFEYTKDIVEIQREVDISSVYTAAYGRGKGEEVGITEDGSETYGRRLTFADVVWSKANGDPVDKPLGQEWVGDPEALALWGRNGRHRFGIYMDPDETDPEKLLQKTWEFVQEHKNPRITYSLTVLDLERVAGYKHEAVRLGDTVYVRDKDLGIDVAARVIEIERDLLRPENTKIVLGNFRPNIADDAIIQAQINRTVSDRQGVWDKATAFGANGKLSTEWLEGIIDTLQNQINAGAGTVTITEDNGILIVDNAENPTAALRLLGGVFAIANTKNPDGTWNWRTFGTGDGFVADEINSGKIRTALVNIFGDTNFYWDADGIKATNPNDPNQWIKFNKDGLFFTKDGGQTYDFSISWSGLYLGTITKEQLSQEIKDAINKKPVIIDDATTAYFPFDGSLESTRGIQPSFSRGSVAYKSDGTQVAVNQSRFEQGKFGQAVLVEEGTTNLVTNPGFENGTIDGWSYISGGPAPDYNYAVTTEDSWEGNYCVKLWTSPNAVKDSSIATAYIPVDTTKTYACSVCVKGDVHELAVQCFDSNNVYIGSIYFPLHDSGYHTNWVRDTVIVGPSNFKPGTAKIRIKRGVYGPSKVGYIDAAQIEEKPYATSFIDGTRSPETLTIPTEGVLNPQEGTVEFWVKTPSMEHLSSHNTTLFTTASSTNYNNSLVGYWVYTTRKLRMIVGTGTSYTMLEGTTVLQPNTWYYIVFKWTSNSASIYLNGQLEAQRSLTPNLIFSETFRIGCSHLNTEYLDSLIDDLRISSRARTDEEIAEYYNSKLPFLDIYATNQAIKSGVSYNSVEISPEIGIRATHPTGEYTQLSGEGLIHYVPDPIYSETTLPANFEGFESGTIPSYITGSGISVTASAKRSGNYGLQLQTNRGDRYIRITFTVTKDNTTVSFYYRGTVQHNGWYVYLDGINKGRLNATTWTQVNITGVSQGKHELTIAYNAEGLGNGYLYFDDFTFEAAPVSRTVIGYKPATGYKHIYGVYIGTASSGNFDIRSAEYIPAIPQTWIQLPQFMKNKNIKVFLSLKSAQETYEMKEITLQLVAVDNSIPAFCVQGYVKGEYVGQYDLTYRTFKPIDFTYLVIIED